MDSLMIGPLLLLAFLAVAGIAALFRNGEGQQPSSAKPPQHPKSRSRTPGEIRREIFEDPALDGFVLAYRFSASDDTPRCQAMDDRIFKVSNPIWSQGWRPPLHRGCNSILIPITKVDDWDGVESEIPGPPESKKRDPVEEAQRREGLRLSQVASRESWATRYRENAYKYLERGDFDHARQSFSMWVEDVKAQVELDGQLSSELDKAKKEYSEFARKDPLYQQVCDAVLPKIAEKSGILQSELYKLFPQFPKPDIFYALYFAADHGKVSRIKKGNTFAFSTNPNLSAPT